MQTYNCAGGCHCVSHDGCDPKYGFWLLMLVGFLKTLVLLSRIPSLERQWPVLMGRETNTRQGKEWKHVNVHMSHVCVCIIYRYIICVYIYYLYFKQKSVEVSVRSSNEELWPLDIHMCTSSKLTGLYGLMTCIR